MGPSASGAPLALLTTVARAAYRRAPPAAARARARSGRMVPPRIGSTRAFNLRRERQLADQRVLGARRAGFVFFSMPYLRLICASGMPVPGS